MIYNAYFDILESIREAVLVWDPIGKIIYTNAAQIIFLDTVGANY